MNELWAWMAGGMMGGGRGAVMRDIGETTSAEENGGGDEPATPTSMTQPAMPTSRTQPAQTSRTVSPTPPVAPVKPQVGRLPSVTYPLVPSESGSGTAPLTTTIPCCVYICTWMHRADKGNLIYVWFAFKAGETHHVHMMPLPTCWHIYLHKYHL